MLLLRDWEYGVFLGTYWAESVQDFFFLFFIDSLCFIVRILHHLSHGIIRLCQAQHGMNAQKRLDYFAPFISFFGLVFSNLSYTCLLSSSTSQRMAYGINFFFGLAFWDHWMVQYITLCLNFTFELLHCHAISRHFATLEIKASVSLVIVLDSISLETNEHVDVYRVLTSGFERQYPFLCRFKWPSKQLRDPSSYKIGLNWAVCHSANLCKARRLEKVETVILVCSSRQRFQLYMNYIKHANTSQRSSVHVDTIIRRISMGIDGLETAKTYERNLVLLKCIQFNNFYISLIHFNAYEDPLHTLCDILQESSPASQHPQDDQ